MATLHALGKDIEGNGLYFQTVEIGLYSSAALRGIYLGNHFKGEWNVTS